METLTNLPSAVPRKKLAFAYDYMSRRVEKTVSTNDSGSWILDSGFSLTYDGWNLIQEQLTSNASHLTNSYVWGLDLSGTLQGAGGIGGLLSSTTQQPSNSTTAFYLFDANGNVGQLVSTNGSILARYEYDPYGKLIKDVADVSVRNNPFRFSTKYADSETGLLYYGYRYYIPEIGRWLSRDPIGERGGRNLYRFVKNRPILRVDIFGLCEIGSTKNEQCEAKIYPWTSTPDLQTVKDELLDAIGTIEALNRLMDLAKISIAAGKSIIDAISEAAEQMNEDGWSLDAGEVAKKAKKVFDEGHGNAGGWFLSTRIKYEVCVCGQLWGTKWVDKTSAWKQFSMGVNGDFGSYDSAFQNKWEAYGRVGKACADHSAEFKGEKIP
jgi:RHS repeat-associated protein